LKQLFVTSAAIEAGAGLALTISPSLTALLLLGSALETPAGAAVGRVAGAALLSLGVACWLARHDQSSPAARGLIAAMLLYNMAAVGILAFVGMRSGSVGVGLWPVVVVHVAMATWCVGRMRVRSPSAVRHTRAPDR
jgi:hypothetical protein